MSRMRKEEKKEKKINKKYKYLNETYELAVKELSVVKKGENREYCRPTLNTCARETSIDTEFCGHGSISNFICCPQLSHALCTDYDECVAGNVTCQVPVSWPCHTNLTCVNSIGSYSCLLPSPHVDIAVLSNSTAFLTCSSRDPCVQSVELSSFIHTNYTWFANDDYIENINESNQIFVTLSNLTVAYKCMITINETISLNSSRVLIDTKNVTNETLCTTNQVNANNTEDGIFSTTEALPNDLATEKALSTACMLRTQGTDVTTVEQDGVSSPLVLDRTSSSISQGTNSLRPQTVITSPFPQDETISPIPQDETISPVPQDKTISHVPQDETISPIPQDETISPVPQDETISHFPQDETTSPFPQYTTSSAAQVEFIGDLSIHLYLTQSLGTVSPMSDVLLNCSVNGNGLILQSYIWYKDGAVFSISSENILPVGNFMTMEDGVYACQINVSTSGGQMAFLMSNTVRLTSLTSRYKTCPCPCSNTSVVVNLTREQVDTGLLTITRELAVDTENLVSTVRRKTSADDSRPVAKFLGALSVVSMLGILVLVVVSDLLELYAAVYNRFTYRGKRILV
ncbi:histone-lysine N-methyltransferase [Elysia marginata]|uniref:Histone-lysine N-methyltransferase n=1 Tax=Elysia marginata TaxID=1093978 RepID=A0AAV4HB26_9GAST|nr:histone-lysine N-methyltransferase [Elysia marginata]